MSAARTQNSAERFHGRSRSERRSCSCASGNGIAGGLRSRTRPSRSLEEEGGGLQKREMCVHTASGLLRQWPLSRPRVALALSGGGRPGIEPCGYQRTATLVHHESSVPGAECQKVCVRTPQHVAR
jgi:hypothetical protein